MPVDHGRCLPRFGVVVFWWCAEFGLKLILAVRERSVKVRHSEGLIENRDGSGDLIVDCGGACRLERPLDFASDSSPIGCVFQSFFGSV